MLPGLNYVTRTRLKVSNIDACPSVGLDNIVKILHIFGLQEVSIPTWPCFSVEYMTRVLEAK